MQPALKSFSCLRLRLPKVSTAVNTGELRTLAARLEASLALSRKIRIGLGFRV